ncbi:MAG: copper chaperone [Chitinophagaceae bacterium]|nr:MAG: copper chaperone [Chitinophagaceae bacterium]
MKHQFKTNINCSGCLSAVTPHLNAETGIASWQVDTQNPARLLTVQTDELTAEEVCKIVQKAGFKAEPLAR